MTTARKNFACAGLCLALLWGAATGAAAQVVGTSDINMTVSLPSPIINMNNLNFGDTYFAVNKPGTSASATVATPTATMTHSPGTPGNARLIPIDTSASNTLLVDISGGIPSTTMNLAIKDNNTATPFITLTGTTTPADAKFRVDTWTFALLPGGGSLAGFSATAGTGVITLSPTGTITLRFGATLRTVPSGLAYSAQTYTGTLKVTADY